MRTNNGDFQRGGGVGRESRVVGKANYRVELPSFKRGGEKRRWAWGVSQGNERA